MLTPASSRWYLCMCCFSLSVQDLSVKTGLPSLSQMIPSPSFELKRSPCQYMKVLNSLIAFLSVQQSIIVKTSRSPGSAVTYQGSSCWYLMFSFQVAAICITLSPGGLSHPLNYCSSSLFYLPLTCVYQKWYQWKVIAEYPMDTEGLLQSPLPFCCQEVELLDA